MTDRIGQQLGHYRLVKLLGKGGFAEVYLGEHVHLGTQVAVKLLHAQLREETIAQFRQEARLLAQLKHPNIVRILDFGVENGEPFLVMDYAAQGTLRQRHARGTPLALPTIVHYVKQIAQALQYAHDRKLIHRDIKPENMFIGENGEVLLSDFGIAAMSQSLRYAGTQDIVGTVTYMAPEQIQAHPGYASDQYALAAVVYEWLSGQPPFRGSYTEVMAKHCAVPPPPLRGQLPISSEVEQVLFTALAKDPKDRFLSVQAFANAFEQAATGKPVTNTGIDNTATTAANEEMQLAATQTGTVGSGAGSNLSPTIAANPASQPPVFNQNQPLLPPYYAPAKPPAPPRNPAQTRRRLLLSALLILLCSLVCLGGSLLTNVVLRPVNQQADINKLDDSSQSTMAFAFYDLLLEQRYDLAYQGLAQGATIKGQTVNPSTFAQIAQSADTADGQITLYYLDVKTQLDSTGTNNKLLMDVTRSNKPQYTVNITLVQVGNHWRIQTADGL